MTKKEDSKSQRIERLEFIMFVLSELKYTMPDELVDNVKSAINYDGKYSVGQLNRDIFDLREAGNIIDFKRFNGYHLIHNAGRVVLPVVPKPKIVKAPKNAKKEPVRPEKHHSKIAPIAAAAREAGLSYGQYVWRYGLGVKL